MYRLYAYVLHHFFRSSVVLLNRDFSEVLQLFQPALQRGRKAEPLQHLRSRRLRQRQLRRVHPWCARRDERLPLGVGEQGTTKGHHEMHEHWASGPKASG